MTSGWNCSETGNGGYSKALLSLCFEKKDIRIIDIAWNYNYNTILKRAKTVKNKEKNNGI